MANKEKQHTQLLSLNPKEIIVKERSREDYGDLEELKKSMQGRIGMIQPIAVQEVEGKYTLLAGGRRLRAALELGIENIPAHVYDDTIDDIDKKVIELSENIHRKNLNMVEELNMKRDIHDLMVMKYGEKVKGNEYKESTGWSITDTAKMLGQKQPNTYNDISLARALDVVPELKKCKNKNEAGRMLDKIVGGMARAEIVKKIKAERKGKTGDRQKKELCNSFIIGNFFKEIKSIPSNSIDFIDLDTPYGIDLDKVKNKVPDNTATLHYNEVPKEEFPVFIEKVLKECYRVLKDTGWIIVWFAPDPWFDTIETTMRKTGFLFQSIPAIWDKVLPGQTRSPRTNLASSYEPFFCAHKTNSVLVKQGRSNMFTGFSRIPPSKKSHPTAKPIELMEEILSTFAMPGSKVLVPFLGSGNTLLAASNLFMKGFGFELSKAFKDSFIITVYNTEGKFKSY